MTDGDIDPAMRSIMEGFRAHGFKTRSLSAGGISTGILSGGFRVELNDGCNVDIYRPQADSTHALARVILTDEGADENHPELLRVNRLLAEKMDGLGDIRPFERSGDGGDDFFYYAGIDMTNTPAYHETVMMSETGEADAAGTVDTDGAAALAEEAVSRLEAVDAGMLRHAIDDLGLPRSDSIRIVLNRLYRSAVDAGELSAAIAQEAGKINRQSEIDTLESLRQNQSAAFLAPLIELLCHEIIDSANPPKSHP